VLRHRLVLLIVPVLALALFAGCSSEARAPQHAILVTVDTLRPDRLGAYGDETAESPQIDLLARQSIRFERAYSHSSMTVPAMATLFSGQLPAVHAMHTNRRGPKPRFRDLPTLATRLHDEGFATAAFVGSYVLRPDRGFDRGFDRYREAERVREHPQNLAGPLTDKAIAWLVERDPSSRLFLWIHYQEPHGPYIPPDFDPGAVAPPRTDDVILPQNDTHSGYDGIPKYQWLGHGRLEEYEARYAGEIRTFDRHLGRLIDVLDELGILDSSVLVFTSDHGESFGEDDLYCAHGEGLGESLLRVPLLLRVASGHPGVRKDRVRLIDVARTMLELLEVDAQGFGGQSLLEPRGDRPVVAQVTDVSDRPWRSVHVKGSELRQRKGHAAELIGERFPGSTSGVADLQAKLAAALDAQAPWPEEQPRLAVPAEEEAALRSLGYVE